MSSVADHSNLARTIEASQMSIRVNRHVKRIKLI